MEHVETEEPKLVAKIVIERLAVFPKAENAVRIMTHIDSFYGGHDGLRCFGPRDRCQFALLSIVFGLEFCEECPEGERVLALRQLVLLEAFAEG